MSAEPGSVRKARPKLSLKMQAIGFLSRREYSRQELRGKLLAELRKRERAARALAASAAATAAVLAAEVGAGAEAARRGVAAGIEPGYPGEWASNGIDDAFAPVTRVASGAPVVRTTVVRSTVVRTTPAAPVAAAEPAQSPEASPVPEPASDPAAEVETLLDWLAAHGYLSDTRFVESRIHARAARKGTLLIRHELAQHGLVLEPAQAAQLRATEFARAQAIWQRKFGTPAGDAHGRAKQARFLAGRGFPADIVRRIVGGEDEF